ncbi:UDP-glucosyltransferase 29-like [Ziziphus jujuba]|uniref:Glycosyltransferase n=1 Tax=Ziziphus jujuba TaxID=326968 RepID=A0A6P4AQ63_ZIZJJ|nr:UDP-glucosyltransferase 29-like [Ziziphus jujuba]
MRDSKQRSLSVLMLPWYAYGHIFPFLELAKQLTRRNFHIYFCSTPVNLNSIKSKVCKFSNSIKLVELNLPTLPDLPPQYHTTKGLPPHLNATLHRASDLSKPDISNMIATLDPDLVIFDYHVRHWVPSLAFSFNVPAIPFVPTGVGVVSFVHHYTKIKDREFPFPELCPDILKPKLVQLGVTPASSTDQDKEREQDHEDGDDESVQSSVETSSYYNTALIKSFRELEGKYIDYLSDSFGLKIIPVGPLVSDPADQDEEGICIIDWLDKREKSSTVFVSFGSECYLSKEDMEEMAYGLELSNVNFLWIIRFPEGEKMELKDALPEGFLERVNENGMVVENWAPQVKILNHSSIGGFVSHCGWSSIMESLRFGVPIIAMPIQHDQPWNAKVVVSSGFGLEVERENGKGLEREHVAKVIKQVLVEKIGENIKRKATKMSENMKGKVEEEMMDVVEKELLQICGM